jgi:hypothetical protein
MIQVEQPSESYNLLQLIMTFILIFWVYYAFDRLINILHVRAAVCSDQQVVIDGLGSFLHCFIQTQSHHTDAVLQTRHNIPAKRILSAYCPVSLKHIYPYTDRPNIRMKLWVAAKCKCFIAIDIDRKIFEGNIRNEDLYSFLIGKGMSCLCSGKHLLSILS